MLYWLYNRLALMLRTRIKSIAHYVPEQIVTNDYLTKYMDTSDEWISTMRRPPQWGLEQQKKL